MRDTFALTAIGSAGLPSLLACYQHLGSCIKHESIDLSQSLFAWSEADGAEGGQPAGFGLLGVRRAGSHVRCSVRVLAAREGALHPDPRPALLQGLLAAARTLGADSVTAEAALAPDPADALAPPADLLRQARFEHVDTLLSYSAGPASILAEPVYLQTGLQEVDPFRIVHWLNTVPASLPPWPAQTESIAELRFPDVTYLMVASGTAAGYLAVSDPHLEEVNILQIGVLADLRRQQIATGALQELLSSHDRIRLLRVPPLVRESDRSLVAFLEAIGFRPTGHRRAEMALALRP